jgi:hypothetical protein
MLSSQQAETYETPKFRQKSHIAKAALQLTIFNGTMNKFVSQCRSRNDPKAKPTVPVACFQTTFSESSLTNFSAKGNAEQFSKENASARKHLATKGFYLTKKMALLKRGPTQPRKAD